MSVTGRDGQFNRKTDFFLFHETVKPHQFFYETEIVRLSDHIQGNTVEKYI